MSYYDVPLLKRPVWKWYIPAYFVCGGVAGASSTLGLAYAPLRRRSCRPLRHSRERRQPRS